MVSKVADGDIALQLLLNGESLSPLGGNTIPGTPFEGLAQMAGTQCRQAVQCGW